MKKVTIYRETPLNSNYRPLFHLAAQEEIDLEVFDHKGFRWAGVKMWHCSPAMRFLLKKWVENIPRRSPASRAGVLRKLVEKAQHEKEPSWGDLMKSFIFPLRLLFLRNIVVAFAPYSLMGYYLLLLKVLGKNVTFFTSWPYWNGVDYVHKPRLGSRKVWEAFLRDVKSVCVTRNCARQLENLGANAMYIPHSVDIHRFTPGKKSPKEKLTLLYVGRVVKEKGVRELSDVFGLLLENYPELELVIVGDGPELDEIRDKKGVICKGYIDNPHDLAMEYQSSDIFVLNSFRTENWQELFGICLIEAMACGLPCVATDCVGPREIVKDGMSGFLVPTQDERALYRTLERLIGNRELRTDFGRNGRERASDYAVDSNARKWKEVIFAQAAHRHPPF
ncbi:MAG: glycosyltransferase family 4 protein [Gemmatimonadota bacterium]|nr:glycosyltransferase family 4 protein [Gemmatimonadota bacterium]